jgi:hypothetical protein
MRRKIVGGDVRWTVTHAHGPLADKAAELLRRTVKERTGVRLGAAGRGDRTILLAIETGHRRRGIPHRGWA